MFKIHKEEIEINGKKVTLETGKIARQADGAIIATCGETVVIATVVGAKNLKDLLNDKKSKITDNLRNNLSFGESITRDKIYNYQKELEKLKKAVSQIFDDFDLIIMPTTPQNSFDIRSKPPENQANFTSLANIADLPSICLPFFNNSKKPSSLQMIASNLNDNFLIKTSSYFEKILQ